MTTVTPNPVTAALSALAAAYRHNLVSYASVPEECQPPRFVVGFGSAAEVRAFEAAAHALANLAPDLFPALGEAAAEAECYDFGGFIAQPETLQFLLGSVARKLLEVAEDHGRVKVLRPSFGYRRDLALIAGLAIAGMVSWDRENAPAEAGEAVNPGPGAVSVAGIAALMATSTAVGA
jgi:hypothetical protein